MLLNIRRYEHGSPPNEPAVIIGARSLGNSLRRDWHLLTGEDVDSLRPLCGADITLDRGSIQANTFRLNYASDQYPKGFFSFDGGCPACKEAAKNGS